MTRVQPQDTGVLLRLPTRKPAKVELAHLDDLRSRLRRYRKIHVICDQATCHTSEAVAIYL
ncbi:MAG TPA: hypothetical protein VKP69_01190, partial [Isosphaeraceae bacterium]|nr:hypothetical protein [Isosphaeraceae bacterium]